MFLKKRRGATVTSAPISEQTQSSATSSTGRSIFEDPAIGEAAKNDAFVRFVSHNWKSLLLALLAIGGAIVGYNIFTTTALEKRARATTMLADIQESYKGIVDKQAALAEKRAQQQKAVDDAAKKTAADSIESATKEIDDARSKIALMIDSLDSPPPFDSYATLYRGLVAARFQDYGAVEQALSKAPSWQAIDDVRSSKRFIAETVTLGLLRSLAQSDSYKGKAKDQLKALADGGEFLAVDALDAFSLIASTPEEQAYLKGALQALKAKFPSQGKRLDLIVERAG